MLNKLGIGTRKFLNQYKYFLMVLISILSLQGGVLIYQKVNHVIFISKIKKLDLLLEKKQYKEVIKIFNGNNSYWINTKSLFVKSLFYLKFMEILEKETPLLVKGMPQNLQLIREGRWLQLSQELEKLPITDLQKDLIKISGCLEKIYQSTIKKIPYTCALSPKEMDYYGEILNLMILLHMSYREDKMALIFFYSTASMQSSLFPSFAKVIYNRVLSPKDSEDLILLRSIPQNKDLAFIRSLINF